jgi:glyoxylase-like metal-dependent hydrolase (beta-lactamase superfamily II)
MLGTFPYPVYLVRGRQEGAILEGGISALGPLLQRQLADLGIGPDFVRQAVITHAHPDHVMAIPQLRAMFPAVKVLASAPAAATLNVDKAIAIFRQIDAALADSLTKSGVIADPISPPPLSENRIAVDRVVREGETITVEDAVWTVLETPGHSDCSITLHDAARRILVISDVTGYYMPDVGTWWPNYFTSYAAYVHSMERLAALDAETVCLSHNGAIRGADAVREYFAGAIAATRQYHERIVAAARSGKAPRDIAAELGAEAHARTPVLPLDFFQKNCSLLVKLSLRHEGIVVEK